MKAIPIKVAADICGVEPQAILDLVRAEKLSRTGRGEGKVKLSEAIRALALPVCPTCGENYMPPGVEEMSE